MKVRECLQKCRELYGALIEKHAQIHGLRPEVVAGIMMRETECGFSKHLDVQGPEGRGDRDKFGRYHGHGLMQIDDRFHTEFIESGAWADPDRNIGHGCHILAQKWRWLERQTASMEPVDVDLERAAIAAYNAGESRVLRCIKDGRNLDTFTAHGNYSEFVLYYAAMYAEMAA